MQLIHASGKVLSVENIVDVRTIPFRVVVQIPLPSEYSFRPGFWTVILHQAEDQDQTTARASERLLASRPLFVYDSEEEVSEEILNRFFETSVDTSQPLHR